MVDDFDYSYDLKIPKERIAVLIGKNGENKKRLETEASIKLDIDSDEGIVNINGSNAIHLYSAREVVRAIGRGFSPEVAIQLFKQDFGLEVLNLNLSARTKNDLIRLKGRIIGEAGKSRSIIEDLTSTSISVYGKTVSIIGDYEGLSLARKAIEMLIKGSRHSSVYQWLEKKKKNLRIKSFVEKKSVTINE